jgi:hypothetical protein
LRLIAGNPSVLHKDSFAKYAVAFFKISRSIFTRANSARSRANSICSSLITWDLPPVNCPCSSQRIQFSNDPLGTPRILATSADDWPFLTSLIAYILNSRVYLALVRFTTI